MVKCKKPRRKSGNQAYQGKGKRWNEVQRAKEEEAEAFRDVRAKVKR